MYFSKLTYKNIKDLGDGCLDFSAGNLSVKKWDFISYSNNPKATLLLRLAAISLSGTRHLPYFIKTPGSLLMDKKCEGFIEPVFLRHPLKEKISNLCSSLGTRYTFHSKLPVQFLKKNFLDKEENVYFLRNLKFGNENINWFSCGFGPNPSINYLKGSVCFGTTRHRPKRFISLFKENTKLTPISTWILRRYKNSYLYGRLGSRKILSETLELISNIFKCKVEVSSKGLVFISHKKVKTDFEDLPRLKKNVVVILIDLIRHIADAYPHEFNPLSREGVVLLNQIDKGLSVNDTLHLFNCMDKTFPNLQFILSLSKKKNWLNKQAFINKTLSVPKPELVKQAAISVMPNGPSPIVLVDVDSRIPNLALMKLSSFYKSEGENVVLAKGTTNIKNAKKVVASSVFYSESSQNKLAILRKRYSGRLELGGSGVDLKKRLPTAIEKLMPDYSLYTENSDKAIGFVTRGCNMSCKFCIVPKKEGKVKQVAKLSDFVKPGQNKVILLDDNLLAYENSSKILQEIIEKKYQVNFNQTLDMRHITAENAALLRSVDSRNIKFTSTVYYFSLNFIDNLELYRGKFKLLNLPDKKTVTFVCMYGFKNSLEQDLILFQFIRSLGGPSVFTQKYLSPLDGPPSMDIDKFFDNKAERNINKLIKIIFYRNMKSMENYYRWVSVEYTKKFRKIHYPLINTIFRYNRRHIKAHYIEMLKGLCK